MKTVTDRFEALFIPEPNSGCWLWTGGLFRKGYGKFVNKGKHCMAHRVSYQLYCGHVPKGLNILHSCDVRCCVNPNHLWVGTVKDNNNDCVQKGQHNYGRVEGELHPSSKLTIAKVFEIRKDPRLPQVIAIDYNISHQCVRDIKNRRTWKHT